MRPPLCASPCAPRAQTYDRDMAARLLHKQRAANYAAAQLTARAVASRRAMSARIHSFQTR